MILTTVYGSIRTGRSSEEGHASRALKACSSFRGWFSRHLFSKAHESCPRSLSEKQCSKRYASLVEYKGANYSALKSILL